MEAGTDLDIATNDLGPLAWVLDELRKSLEAASAALRRFVRDTALARGTDMASVDGGQLRIARQQLHQAVGALEMVGLGAPAHVLRCMEAAVQKFVEQPQLCSEAAAAKVERCGFALAEYLESVLLGKASSAVGLFPQYKDVQELSGADRVHPADLWNVEWRWMDPATPAADKSRVYDPAVRSRMDQAVLKVVKSADAEAARELTDISLSLAATQTARQPKIFWKICAAFFEALGQGLLPLDLYVKRAGSRVLLQYASLAKGDLGVSDRLAQDLVFFCGQAQPKAGTPAPSLAAVRSAWALDRQPHVDYSTVQFGRFDPALVAQVRKRIAAAKETWSSLSGGDATKLKGVSDQFNQVADSLAKLHGASAPLASGLTKVIEAVVRLGRPPAAEVAMEVATAVLYLEAAFADLDLSDEQLTDRTQRLAARLDRVLAGGQPEPLEPWMEELYRRVSDRQTMGSVVGELRGTLAELEKLLDQFFRNPADKAPLRDAPGHLLQMKGVLSVLGLDQASQAVGRMRDAVEEIMVTEVDEARARAAGTFDKLGNNLGALGFLIDMLNYQPSLAKKLFVYDEPAGELRPLMGRVGHPHDAHADDTGMAALTEEVDAVVSGLAPLESPEQLTAQLDTLATHAVLADKSGIASTAREAAAAVAQDPAAAAAVLNQLAASVKPAQPPAVAAPAPEADIEEDDLRDIFLEEAREVVGNGLAAITSLTVAPADVGELTTLRRAFHTLKGSSRMVGLTEFGEAAWALEQVLNTWLADQKPANDDLRTLSREAMQGFSRWIEDIAANADAGWKSHPFRASADALRVEQRHAPIALPQQAQEATDAHEAPAEAVQAPVALEAPSFELPAFDLEAPVPADAAAPVEPAAEPLAAVEPEPVFDMSFDMQEPAAAPAEPVAQEALAEPAPIELAPPAEAAEPAMDVSALEYDLNVPSPATPAVAPELSFEEVMPAADMAPATALPAVAEAAQAPAATEAVELDVDPAAFGMTQVIRGDAPEVSELHAHELPADFDFGAPESAASAGAQEIPQPEVTEIEGIDFASLAAVSATAPSVPAQPEAPQPATEVHAGDDQVKVIGNLRIGIPLYNVYLNEADEWSRRLATELGEWALELNQPVPDSAVGLAHALAGSSATVGFEALSDIARALETATAKAQTLAYGTPQHGKAFVDAADEIRRLLHQFAAGFLKDPDTRVIDALHALDRLDVPRATDSERQPLEPFAMSFDEPPAAPVQAEPAPVMEAEPISAEPISAEPMFAEPMFAAPMAAEPMRAEPVPVRAAQAQVALTDDEDFDIADAIDPDLFPIFEEEAVELMPRLGGALRDWSANPQGRDARDEALRALHTLKGSARLAGALRLGEIAHRLESQIESLGESPATSDLDALLHRFDMAQANFDALRNPAEAAETPASVQAQPAAAMPAPIEVHARSQALVPRPVATQVAVPRAAAGQAVRVRSQLLDRLVNQAGEVMITRSRLEAELGQLRGSLTDLTGNLDRLRAQLRDIELQAETQMQSRLAQSKDTGAGFDPLEFDRFTRVQELTRMMAESVNDVATVQRNLQRTVEATEDDLIAQARQTRELQRDLLRTRMVEFEGISDRLYRVIRLASKETGKQVKLDITGGSIEMDRGVLDRMTPAFEHLLRNCVAHGIESPAQRVAAGKDASGTVLINLHHEGNDVSVDFSDDGAGLDIARIREKAVQQGLISPAQDVTGQDAANLIFTPGFSTASEVTELAGRGIGMDVVRAEVNALGGRIETTTVSGKGTTFKLVLPLTTAVTQVVMIRSGSLSIGVPANLVEIVRRAPAKDVQQAYNSGTFDFGGEQLPFFWSGALLQSSAHSLEPQGKTLPVVIFRSAAQRIAVHVDEILGNQEVVVKNLGPQLARLPGLAGMTVLASGAVVLIYNPVALSTVYGDQARSLSADKAQPEVMEAASVPVMPVEPAAPQIPLVLVVDDSITVRRVTQRLLQREGYRVALAADGLQALERLAEEKPAVVLSDIEMPRMDGFDLARNIRGDVRMKALPIIMITSRIAEKHREHAKELGVDHYLGKPYSEEELLSLVKHYCAAAVTA